MAEAMPLLQMSPEYENILTKNRKYILKNLICGEDLLSHLMTTGTLTGELKQEIQSYPKDVDKIGKLLDLLPKRGPKAFRNFLSALIESGQEFIAASLDSSLTNYILQSGEDDPDDLSLSTRSFESGMFEKDPGIYKCDSGHETASVSSGERSMLPLKEKTPEVTVAPQTEFTLAQASKICDGAMRSASFVTGGNIVYSTGYDRIGLAGVRGLATIPSPPDIRNAWKVAYPRGSRDPCFLYLTSNNKTISVYTFTCRKWVRAQLFETKDNPSSLASVEDVVYVITSVILDDMRSLCKYKKNKLEWTKTFLDNSVKSMAVDKEENCYLLGSACIYKYTKDGQAGEIGLDLNDSEFDHVEGFCVCPSGNFLVAGAKKWNSQKGTVAQISANGDFIRELTTCEGWPTSITFDEEYGLTVGTSSGLYFYDIRTV